LGIHCSSWAWKQRVDDFGAKLMLVKLADNANDSTGVCWPGQQLLADDCCMSRSTVQRKLYLLRELELVEIKERYPNPKRPGQRGSNYYKLNCPLPHADASEIEPVPHDDATPASQLSGDGGSTGEATEPEVESPVEHDVGGLLDFYDFNAKQRAAIEAVGGERARAWLVAGRTPPVGVKRTAGWVYQGVTRGDTWPPGYKRSASGDERFERAKAYVTNAAYMYEGEALREELERYKLSREQLELLAALAADLRERL
jgi:hypothetical protein